MKCENLLKVGKGLQLDDGVILGYKTGRNISDWHIIIGDYAHLRAGTIIYAGSKIGSGLQTGHNVIIREENLIGDNFQIWSNSVVDYGCKIGNNVKVHANVYIAQFTIIEDDVFIAPGVCIANDIHPKCRLSSKCMKGPTIKMGAQIGVNSTIMPFITIGENSLVGAGSVVTKDVPSDSVVYGNPAKVRSSIFNLKCATKLMEESPYLPQK
jgi:acetyltransferase-like isoleucine patch superfamily enzyme